ncbi:ecdysone 20-monooxygenase-like [Daphnia carinata]|uniref:ecdysone 20-monooxygenase-like n=1 Tax=Daphnia carinata TaxID=120202 RepID=UPI00257C4E61|nr:ecdysone 20-monooxygenase-like [Daphnia carinata]
MRFLKKLKRVTVLVAQHVTRVVKVIWSFLATQEKADDRKFPWNENRLSDGDILPKGKPFSEIPGPLPLPFFGSQWLYSWIGPYFLDKLHLANEDKYFKYGPIVKEHYLWNFPIVHLYDKNDIETVLKYSSKYPIRPGLEAQIFYRNSRPDRYKSVGLVNVQGLEWHHLRSKLTTQLASTALGDHTVKQLSIISEELIEKIRDERDAKNIIEEFEKYIYSYGLEVIFAILLGRRLGALNKSSIPPIAERLMFATENLFEVSHETMYGLPWWKYFPTKSYRKLAECEDIIYDVFSDLVKEALINDETTDTQSPVLNQILTAEGVDTRDKIVSLIDLVAAGIETTGNATLFLLHNILNNPEVKVRVYEELDRVLPSPEDTITPQLLVELKYLRACIIESLRMTPVAPNVARILEKPFTFQGYHVPAGTLVVCETWVASLQEENYLNAKSFIPERWLDSDKPNRYPFLAVPFGVGRRMCPGKRIAENEMLIITAKLLRAFDISFHEPLEQVYKFLISPKGPIKVMLRERC